MSSRTRVVLAVLAALTLTASLGALPTATPASAAAPAPSWLDEANLLRSHWSVPVPTLTEDAALSRQDAAHVSYLDHTSTCAHAEDPASPYYSDAGNAGGTHSVVFCGPVKGAAAVSGWAATPYHGEQVLNPRLTVTGFSDAGDHAAMDTLTHVSDAPAPTGIATWPAGTDVPLLGFNGLESPDPLAHCPQAFQDRRTPSVGSSGADASYGFGPTLFASFPTASPPAATATSFRDLSTGVDDLVCVLHADATTSFPFLLTAMIPLHPLTPGDHYTASYDTNADGRATWDFTVARTPTSISEPRLLDGRIAGGYPVELIPTFDGPEHATLSYDTRPVPTSTSPDPAWVPLPARDSVIYGGRTSEVQVPVGPLQLRISFAGDAHFLPSEVVYTLVAEPVALPVPHVNDPGTHSYGAHVTLLGEASLPVPRDDSLLPTMGARVQLLVRPPGGAWIVRAQGTALDDGVTPKVTGTLVYTTPGSQFQVCVRDPAGTDRGCSAPATVSIARSVAGWSAGTIRAPASTTLTSLVQVRPRPDVVWVQYRPGSSASWSTLARLTPDPSGRVRVSTRARSGQYRVYVPAVGGFAASASLVRTEYRS